MTIVEKNIKSHLPYCPDLLAICHCHDLTKLFFSSYLSFFSHLGVFPPQKMFYSQLDVEEKTITNHKLQITKMSFFYLDVPSSACQGEDNNNNNNRATTTQKPEMRGRSTMQTSRMITVVMIVMMMAMMMRKRIMTVMMITLPPPS